MKMLRLYLASALCALGTLALSGPANATDEVALIIDQALYNSGVVGQRLLRYEAEVEARFPVNLRIFNEAAFESYTPQQMRTYIINLYNTYSIKGVILVGQIRYALWKNYAPGADDRGISSFYYEDLDGTFTDTNADGYDDLHNWGAHIGPEIWCIWMRPLANNQVPSLIGFLDKVHRYYNGEVAFNHRALVAGHADYDGNIPVMVNKLQPLYGSNIDTDGVGADFVYSNEQVAMLNANRYEIYDPWSHASSGGHSWDSGSVSSYTVSTMTGGTIMAFIYGCHTAAFNEAPSSTLAQVYPFGSSIGQAGSGTSWNYGTEGKQFIYEEFARGSYLGKAWMNMEIIKNTPQYMRDRYGQTFDADRHLWGDTLIGNPFVYTNYVPPQPTALFQAKALADGSPVVVTGAIITAKLTADTYVEQSDRACGIKVIGTTTAALGRQVKVTGIIGTENGERVIRFGELTDLGAGSAIDPLAMAAKSLHGRTGCSGLENMGLLVKVAGTVRASGTGWFTLDDGSGLTDPLGNPGIKIRCDGITPPTSGFPKVTGISTTELSGGTNYPVVRVRSSGDISP